MTCSDARQQIFAERDGALGEPQRAALAEHLAGCAQCRRVREGLAITVEAWQADVREVRVPSAEIEWQKLRRVMQGPATAPRRSLATWIAVPAAAAAAVAIGLYVVPHQEPHAISANSSQAVAVNNAPVALSPASASTVVYVDDKSGWTFVWEPTANDRQI